MREEKLERICAHRFGSQTGKKLAGAITKVHSLDFYVEIGSHSREIRVGRGISSRLMIFNFNDDYSQLIFPDGKKMSMEEISYKEISKYLPKLSM